MGQRSAVRTKTGQTVANSVPGVAVGPTPPARTGLKPVAGPPSLEVTPNSHAKSWQGLGDGVPKGGGGEAADTSYFTCDQRITV